MPATTGTVALTSDIVSQVEDNITDGHTTIAPSGNAVFDALALKAPLTTPTFVTSISTPAVLATANDSGALGASGTAFSDLFLASGGVINWAAGNATLTHSTGLLTSNVPLSLGTSNALTAGTIELGAASDTTIARVSAGLVSIEGNNIITANNQATALAATAVGDKDKYLHSNASTGAMEWSTPSFTLGDNTVSAGKMQGASSTKLSNGSAGNLLKSLGDGTFGWDTTAYVSGTPWTGMGYYIGDGSAFATAAQGSKADTALQSLSGALLATGATTGATSQAQTLTSGVILGTNTSVLGTAKFFGSTSGDVTLQPNAIAGTSIVLTLPATTGTLVTGGGTASGTNTGDNAANSSSLPIGGGTLTGNLLFTDNTLDIGASGATRPRTIYLGTSAIVPTIAGSVTTANNLTLRANTADLTTGQVNITSSLEASSTSAAALTTAGGLGVAKRLWTTDLTSTNLPTLGGVALTTTMTKLNYLTSVTGTTGTTTGKVVLDTAPTFVTSITTPSVLATANDSGALGASGTAFSDLFLASGGVINWAAGASTITHSANTLTIGGSGATTLALGTNNLTMTGSIGATGARVTKLWTAAIESTALPTINGGTLAAALGNYGGFLTSLSGALLATGATTGATSQAQTLTSGVILGTNTSVLGTAKFFGSTSGDVTLQPNAIAGTGIVLTLPATTGTVALTSDIVSQVEDNITDGHTTIAPSGNAVFDALALKAPLTTPTFVTSISTPAVLATANDSGALGASGTAFSDLFLASGGVINWAAGNASLTHSTGLLTSNVPLSLGTSNALTAGTIELGAASDTTIARVSAGLVSIEEEQYHYCKQSSHSSSSHCSGRTKTNICTPMLQRERWSGALHHLP